MAKLARSVVLRDPATNRYVSLVRGTELPEWAAGLVTNPRALVPSEPQSNRVVDNTIGSPATPAIPVPPASDPPAAPPVPVAPEGFDPKAKVEDILDQVGDDSALAALYLEAELAKGDAQRSTLVDRLAVIVVSSPPHNEQ